MLTPTLLSFSTLLLGALASPHVVHEKRSIHTDRQWSKTTELDSNAILPFRIGLTQGNLENGDSWLMDVSDPTSANYGKHWTAAQVIDAFKPSEDTIRSVHDWLVEGGIDSTRHRLSEGLNWLEFHATASEAESLFNAKYHVFTHTATGTRHVACDEYSLPAHIQSHVDFITPGVHFDAKTRQNTIDMYDAEGNQLEKRGNPWWPGPNKKGPHWPGWPGWPGPVPHNPMWHPHPASSNICNDSFVTPYCIRLLYDVPTDLTPAEGNSVGIVEYTPESFLQSDLNTFFKAYEPQAVGEAPKFDSIDGGYLFRGFNTTTSFEYLGEPSLDLQYAMSLLYPQNVVLYQVGDLAEASNTSFNNFLDAIDASYCTYDGGDTPGLDAVYPDPYPGPHSYKGKENCGTYAPAKVISTSYGYGEYQLPASYEVRQCHEYMKLGLMGVTFAYSSGDYGVGGYGGQCVTADGNTTDGTSGNFVPDFPASCPYVLAVGATQIRNGTNNVAAAIQAGQQPEVAMELYLTPQGLVGTDFPIGANPIGQNVFSSSGGFSNVFSLPSYQQSAVTAYNQKYAPKYPGQYNDSGKARGIPDIASNGAWLSIVVNGNFSQVFGTSCAAPTVSALLGLINGERMKAGKSSVGFVNPTLYANPHVLNDVTAGGNPGCGTYGFNAEAGWDPVTGLGTPNFPKMLQLFMSLP